MTPRDTDTELERAVDEALAGLPMPTAPRTLAPRILRAAALHAYHADRAHQARPASGWLAWSAPARVGSAAVFVAVLALAAWLGVRFEGALAPGVSELARVMAITAGAISGPLLELQGFVRPFWHVIGEPIAGVALLLIVAMLAACVAGAAALEHLTVGEPTP